MCVYVCIFSWLPRIHHTRYAPPHPLQVCINKADGDLLPAARRTKVDYMHALQLMRPKIPVWCVAEMRVCVAVSYLYE
jgi:hypothetical protein